MNGQLPLRMAEAWRLRGDTVTLNSCLRSWPWQRGIAMMATSQVGFPWDSWGSWGWENESNKFWRPDMIR